MSEREEQYFNTSTETEQVQAIQVDLARLRKVEVINLSGRTFITGTNDPEIRVRTNHRGVVTTPVIEVKNDGREVEIRATPINQWDWDWDWDWSGWSASDPDVAHNPPHDNYDEWNGPQRLDFSYDEAGREEYHRHREEWRAQREQWREQRREQQEQRREQRETWQRQREELKEQARRAKEQAKEEAHRAKEQLREAMRGRGGSWWRAFDTEAFAEIAKNIGKTVSEMVSVLGDLYVEVPAGVELQVKSTSGMIEITNINGYCQVKNSSGVIKLNRVTGGVQLKGLSGRVEGRELGGPVSAKVTSGAVQLLNCRMTALDLSVNSGNATIETTLALPDAGDYKVSTTSGKVQLRIPRDSRASIDCRTLSGRIDFAPEMRAEYRNRPGQSQSRLDLNGGGRKITLNAVSGNIELGWFDPDMWSETAPRPEWPAPPPPPPAPPAPPDFIPPVRPPYVPPVPGGFGSIPPVPPGMSGPGGVSTPPYPAPPVSGGWRPVPPTTPKPPTPPDFVPPSAPNAQPQAESRPLVTPPPPTTWPVVDDNQTQQKEDETKVVDNEEAPAQTSEAASTPVQAQPEDEKKKRQLEILRAIERGEISIEEGMARLGELDEG